MAQNGSTSSRGSSASLEKQMRAKLDAYLRRHDRKPKAKKSRARTDH